MAFNPNIPVASDFLAVSQKQVLSNFQAIATAFLENHVPLTSEKNLGMHEVLILRPQSDHPTTTISQSAIYNKLVSSIPQLFFRPNSDQTPIQLSNEKLNTIQTGATADAQSSFIAGPFTVYVGYFIGCPNPQPVTLLPASDLIYVGLSTVNPQGNIFLPNIAIATTIVANTFIIEYKFTPGTTLPLINYMAIGK